MGHGALCRSCLLLFFLLPSLCLALPGETIQESYPAAMTLPLGERIAFWAELFVGTAYDSDPDGAYVTREQIVADDRVDCMYLVFRSIELALGANPREAEEMALDRRFHTKGRLESGRVTNYDDRFRYGMDMILSGKWGREITPELGRTEMIRGSRRIDPVELLTPGEAVSAMPLLMSGDIIFFVKRPEERVAGEVIGHMGIIRVGGSGVEREVWLVHASGTKGTRATGGSVRKVRLGDYLRAMPFAGVKVTRLP